MTYGDDLLIDILKKLWQGLEGRDEGDQFPRSVADFSVDFVLTSCCLMLKEIVSEQNNDIGNVFAEIQKLPLATRAPRSMAERFNLGLKLADICSESGFVNMSGFGYQTFLYGSEAEVRKVLMFLLEKIRLEEEDDEEAGIGCVANVDPFCSCTTCLNDLSAYDAIRILPRESKNAAFNLLSNVSANNTGCKSYVEIAQVTERLKEYRVATNEVRIIGNNRRESEEMKKIQDVLRGLKREREEKEHQLRKRQQSYYNIRGNIGALTSKNKQLEEVIASNEKENAAKRVEHDHRSKTANLFEEDLEHMNRVQTKATKRNEKITTLGLEWEKAREKLVAREEDLAFQLEVFSSNEDGILHLSQKLEEVAEEILDAELQLSKKKSALEVFSITITKIALDGAERQTFTNRILKILESIRKQREETNKAITCIQQTQRDINLLGGKLDRTYGEVNYKVFEVARSEAYLRPTYRHTVSLHYTCADIVETLRLIGRTKRAVRDVRDAIEEEKLLSSGDKLHQISVDLQTLTRENEYLNHEVQNCPI